MLLPIVVTTVGICYSGFNGHFTPVTSLSQILSNFGNTDIRLRYFLHDGRDTAFSGRISGNQP